MAKMANIKIAIHRNRFPHVSICRPCGVRLSGSGIPRFGI
jgi:hypothetical protein